MQTQYLFYEYVFDFHVMSLGLASAMETDDFLMRRCDSIKGVSTNFCKSRVNS